MFLKQKIIENRICLGGWTMLGHPASAEIMARSGLDWVAIDLEHSAIDIATTENLIRAIEVGGGEALVRLTNNDPNLIKRVMDSGASGIIVPMVETAEDAQKAVEALYYPPKGKRGVGLARAQQYGPGFETYKNQQNHKTVCVVQIEHINAVNNLEEIFAIKEVDAFLVGPYDLSASMGLIGQIDHPDVKDALNKIHVIAKAMSKPGGLHIVEPDEDILIAMIEDGFKFIAYSIDTRIIDKSCRSAVLSLRKFQ